jgi:uncharacterized protein (DUF427 family)
MPVHRSITIYPSPKRVRVRLNGKTVADSLKAALLLESEQMPTYYFSTQDVQLSALEESGHRTPCAHKGERPIGTRRSSNLVENAAWGYRQPGSPAEHIAGYIHLSETRWITDSRRTRKFLVTCGIRIIAST